MKWIAFAVALVALIPLAEWLRKHPNQAQRVWILFGLLPFTLNPHISLIDWAGWPGYVFGLQITGLDLLSLALLFAMPKKVRNRTPFRVVMGLYFFAIVMSVFQASVPMAAIFYVWQLARAYLVYLVVVRACEDERAPMSILTGMAIALGYEAVLAIYQRFGTGVLQVPGSFGDKNLLGLASEFAMFPLFALLLAKRRTWQSVGAPLAGLLIAVLTTSRAAVGFGAIGLVVVFIFSAARGWTSRKAAVLSIGAIVVILISPLVAHSFTERFGNAPIIPDSDERDTFNKAASLILSDHPFGIGANNYVIAANSGGYLTRAGVPWGGDQRQAIVHNFYWLTAAEAGYLGVITLVLMMTQIIITGLRCSWQNKRDIRGDILMGLGITVIVVLAHAAYEWVFVIYNVQYLFAMTTGMIAGLTVQLGYWKHSHIRGGERVLGGNAEDRITEFEKQRALRKGLREIQ